VRYVTLTLAFSSLILGACGGPAEPHVASHTPSAAHTAHWGYGADNGPAHWASLAPDFALCGTGTAQSPIALPTSASPGDAKLFPVLRWAQTPPRVLDNGHTIQVTADGASRATVAGAELTLAQFHFHVPSEHTVGEKTYDAEAHFVHKDAAGKLFVIGVLLSKGPKNEVLAPLFTAPLDTVSTERLLPGAPIDLPHLLGPSVRFFHYQGSLTTPPCTEGVAWYVVDPASSPATLSEEQLAILRTAMHGDDHRAPQPLGAREVMLLAP
jgi:carbonic anhydrase